MLRITSPAYSTKYPVAPPVVNLDIIYSATSLAVTPLSNFPLKVILIVLGLDCKIHCVANTISTSDVPIPNAIEPKAP